MATCRRSFRRGACLFWLVAMLFLGLPNFAVAQPRGPLTLTIPEARAMARKALLAGDFKTAAILGRTLLKRDRDDFTALIILAGAEQAMGQNTLAITHAKRAYGLSGLKQARFDAAMIISRAEFGEKHFVAAQYWLRRSGQTAPNRRLAALARREFRYVARVKPFETRFEVTIAPSSNVNNGAQSGRITINGLPFVLSGDAQALAGTVATLGLKVSRRFWGRAGETGHVGVNLLSRSARLTPAARALSGGKSGADYAFAAAEIEVGLSGAGGADSGLFTIGRNWYGGTTLSDYVRTEVSQAFTINKTTALAVGLSAERQIRLDKFARSASLGGVSLSASFGLGGGNIATLRYGLSDVFSASPEIASVAHMVSASYALARPVLGAQLSFGAGISAKFFKAPYLSPRLRRDFGVSAYLSILLPKYAVMGFAPNINVDLSRNFSNERLYDTVSQSVSIGVKSTF